MVGIYDGYANPFYGTAAPADNTIGFSNWGQNDYQTAIANMLNAFLGGGSSNYSNAAPFYKYNNTVYNRLSGAPVTNSTGLGIMNGNLRLSGVTSGGVYDPTQDAFSTKYQNPYPSWPGYTPNTQSSGGGATTTQGIQPPTYHPPGMTGPTDNVYQNGVNGSGINTNANGSQLTNGGTITNGGNLPGVNSGGPTSGGGLPADNGSGPQVGPDGTLLRGYKDPGYANTNWGDPTRPGMNNNYGGYLQPYDQGNSRTGGLSPIRGYSVIPQY